MQVRPRAYPHPVLSSFGDDIVDSTIQATVSVKGTKTAYVFDVTIKTSNKDLEKMVLKGDAQYSVHVECATTRYRGLFPSRKERFVFEIPANQIDGRVELCTFVTATQDIASYRNKAFHPDYEKLTFAVKKGDTLAVAPDQVFSADKEIDPLKRIPSIFSIVPNEAADAPPIDVDTSGDKIVVSLAVDNFKAYSYLRQSQPMHAVLNSAIITPALISVLEHLKRSAGDPDALADLESRRWFRALSRRLADFGKNAAEPDAYVESSVSLAQRLIGAPLTESLKTLKGIEETEDEG